MVCVDDLRTVTSYRGRFRAQSRYVGKRNGHRWCHLFAAVEDRDELHDFAEALGMRREWFHKDHYDITPRKREEAVKAGAVQIHDRALLLKIIGRR